LPADSRTPTTSQTPPTPIAGRLRRSIEEWRLINAAELVEEGIQPEWKDSDAPLRLERERYPHQYQPRGPQRAAYQMLLSEELKEGVIARIPEDQVKWINPTVLVPKKEGKFRKILDCRRFNREIRDRHFRMEGVEDLTRLIEPNDWATSLDFHSAFNHVPVATSFQPYLCFRFQSTTYSYQGMPFGVKHAPRIFTRVMKAAVQEVRRRWSIRMLSYMDDSILLFSDATTAHRQTAEIADYFQRLGWTLAANKCQLVPLQTAQFLGWSWNLRTLQLTIPTKRRTALLGELRQWIVKVRKRERCAIKDLAALLGRLNHLRFQITEASLYMRRTIQLMGMARRSATWTGHCWLNPTILGELKWWTRRISANTPRDLSPRAQSLLVTTDASPWGWGAEVVTNDMTINSFGLWKAGESALTSNAKELTAVRKALQEAIKFNLTQRGTEILIRSDNTTTVFLIKRWSACLTLVSHLRALFNLTRKHDLLLRATYLPGVLNGTADRLSRMGSAMDFSLNPTMFRQVTLELNLQPEVDVFADRDNHLLDAYACLSPTDGAAIAVDGFTLRWTERPLWLHPPITLIGRVIAKLKAEPTQAILVTPMWEGQPWSPQLRQLALKEIDLGSYDSCMIPGAMFQKQQWLFPPGHARATLVDTKTTPGKNS
jgi:hypothetical protein